MAFTLRAHSCNMAAVTALSEEKVKQLAYFELHRTQDSLLVSKTEGVAELDWDERITASQYSIAPYMEFNVTSYTVSCTLGVPHCRALPAHSNHLRHVISSCRACIFMNHFSQHMQCVVRAGRHLSGAQPYQKVHLLMLSVFGFLV